VAIAGRGPRAERLAAERADWVILAGKPLEQLGSFADQVRARGSEARGRPPAIAWNPAASWTEEMVAETRSHFAYMTIDLPPESRLALGVDDDLVARLREVVSTRGPEAAADLVPGSVLDHYALTGDRAGVTARLRRLCARIEPELLVFDASDYSADFVAEAAAVAIEAGAVSGPMAVAVTR
jgi:alkanesulfonate monooxygenase SsuD/methylene tetrahydromethanopterin reductase-like flavin-dependent oxidoreductase (luciferase family)